MRKKTNSFLRYITILSFQALTISNFALAAPACVSTPTPQVPFLRSQSYLTVNTGEAFSRQLRFGGGKGPYSIRLDSSRSLPPELSVTSKGLISGQFNLPQSCSLYFTIKDSKRKTASGYYSISVEGEDRYAMSISKLSSATGSYGPTFRVTVVNNTTIASGLIKFTVSSDGVPNSDYKEEIFSTFVPNLAAGDNTTVDFRVLPESENLSIRLSSYYDYKGSCSYSQSSEIDITLLP